MDLSPCFHQPIFYNLNNEPMSSDLLTTPLDSPVMDCDDLENVAMSKKLPVHLSHQPTRDFQSVSLAITAQP